MSARIALGAGSATEDQAEGIFSQAILRYKHLPKKIKKPKYLGFRESNLTFFRNRPFVLLLFSPKSKTESLPYGHDAGSSLLTDFVFLLEYHWLNAVSRIFAICLDTITPAR
jgi:hypothetical protein